MFNAGGQADGQRDMKKLTVAFRYFTDVPKEKNHISIIDGILGRT
jgi:hypothetical protein